MSRHLRTAVVLVLFFVSALFVFLRAQISTPVIAVIDSGLNVSPALQSRLAPGFSQEDLRDSAGHGTQMAEQVHSICSRCLLLPIKITETGSGTDPDRLAAAIDRARNANARVINISLGLHATSPALSRAIEQAHSNGVLIVAATGGGIANPFRPEPLSQVHPQADPRVLVVGAVRPLGAASVVVDTLSNYGPEVDLSLKSPSSSLAAAKASGIAGQWLATNMSWLGFTPDELRHWLRAETGPLSFNSSEEDIHRAGYGVLEEEKHPPSVWSRLQAIIVPSSRIAARVHRTGIDFSSDSDIREIRSRLQCAGEPKSETAVVLNSLTKGRARIRWQTHLPYNESEPFRPASSRRDCLVHAELITVGGKRLGPLLLQLLEGF